MIPDASAAIAVPTNALATSRPVWLTPTITAIHPDPTDDVPDELGGFCHRELVRFAHHTEKRNPRHPKSAK
jgi:hypothetical protein